MCSFLGLSNTPLHMSHSFFIHSSVNVLATLNSAAVNNGIHVSFSVLVSSGYMPSSGIVGSYGGFILSFIRNLHTIFHSGCINLHSYLQCKSVPFLHTLSSICCCTLFEMMATLTRVKWYLIVVLICISLIMSSVEHLFMCLLAICMSSLKKYLFKSLSHFWLGCLLFWHWVVWATCIFGN